MEQTQHTPKVMSVAGTKGSPLRLNEQRQTEYFALGARPRSKVATIEIPRRTGRAFELGPADPRCRIQRRNLDCSRARGDAARSTGVE